MRVWLGISVLGGAALAPAWVLVQGGVSPFAWPAALASGAVEVVGSFGFVVVPQVLLGIAVVGLALEQLARRVAGLPARPLAGWLDPAVESALLLGMLGTLSGMVRGFEGLTPETLEPGPLLHGLGTALRSSFVGFGIALVGVWTRAGAETTEEAVLAEAHR